MYYYNFVRYYKTRHLNNLVVWINRAVWAVIQKIGDSFYQNIVSLVKQPRFMDRKNLTDESRKNFCAVNDQD